MKVSDDRRRRLHNLLDLARVAKGWSKAELARALKRDPTKLYGDSGNPKLDFVVALSNVLEWPVDDVVESLWGDDPEQATCEQVSSFLEIDEFAMKAHREGRYRDMIEHARHMREFAQNADERACSYNREAGGWDGMGRFPKSLEAVRRGLQQSPLETMTRLKLQGNLANAYYTLWELTPALGVTKVLLDWYAANPPTDAAQQKRPAFAHYVRGNTLRRLMSTEPELCEKHAILAREDLLTSAKMYQSLAQQLGDHSLAGIAHTCRGALVEVDVELRRCSGESAVDTILSEVEDVVDLTSDDAPTGDWLESYGWWCIFGGNIALRHLEGRHLQQSMAVFTNKAIEIADHLDNWAMRERVFTMQYALHEAMVRATDFELDFTIDDEDRRLIAGTMGRFPRFRGVGWRILQTAKVVAAS